ncbi:hypothetical protein OROHE_024497 [Orobanche hederae]
MLAMAEELGHDNSMLSMAEAEGLGGHGSLFWDDDSWAFPILESEANDGLKMSTGIGDSDRRHKGEEVEVVAPAPPAAAPKGKKRKAGPGAAGSGGKENERNGCGGDCGKASGGKNGGGDGGGEGKDGGGCGGEHEQHIWIERERRKKMRDMFTSLHSLIPHLPPKADKANIVDEAVQYIQKLEQTLESLEKQKSQMLKGKTSLTNTRDVIPSTITQNKKQLSFQSREAFLAEQGSADKPSHVALANPNPLFQGIPTISKTWTSPNVTLNVYGEDAHINICCPKKPDLLTGFCFVLEKYRIEVVSAQISADRDRCMCMIHVRATGPVVQFQGSLFLVEEIFKQAAMEIMVWVQKPYVVGDYIN